MHKRIMWLDAMKGFMIIFVVLCHSLVLNKNLGIQGHVDSTLMYIVNIFIMPVFFAVSGFLHRRVRSRRQYLILWYKKVMGLFIPYLIFAVLLHYYMQSPLSLVSIFYQPVFLLWFLLALFWIFIIVGTLDLLRVSVVVQLLLYLVAMGAQTRLNWWNGPDYDMNLVACTLGYLAFFYVGYLIKRYFNEIKQILRNKFDVIAWFVILTIGTWLQIKYTGIFPYNPDQVMLSDIIVKMISVFAFFSLFIAVRHMSARWLIIIGQGTLVVYLVHYFAVHSVFMGLMTFTSIQSPIIQSIIRFICGIGFSLIVVWLVRHVKWVRLVFYPRSILDRIFLRK